MRARSREFDISRYERLGFLISAFSFIISIITFVVQYLQNQVSSSVVIALSVATVGVFMTFVILRESNRKIEMKISEILRRVEILNHAEPVYRGPIGFQQRAIRIERITKKERISLSGHLPSFLRRMPLSEVEANIIFTQINKTSRRLQYANLINERGNVLFDFVIENHSREIFSKVDMLIYTARRFLFYEVAIDPVCEILERFEVLLMLLRGKSYDRDTKTEIDIRGGSYKVHFVDTFLPVYFLMKDGHGILFDGRSRNDKADKRHRVKKFGGMYSRHKDLLNYFLIVFEFLWSGYKEDSSREFILKLKSIIYESVCSTCDMRGKCYDRETKGFIGLLTPVANQISNFCVQQSNKRGKELMDAAIKELRKVLSPK